MTEFQAAKYVRVALDVVAFEDGEVYGPDRSRTIENIENRDSALRALLQRASSETRGGVALGTFLDKVAPAEWPSTGGIWQRQLDASRLSNNLFNFWLAELSRFILELPSSAEALKILGGIPRPPKFFRALTN
jgi:hypothetical protein